MNGSNKLQKTVIPAVRVDCARRSIRCRPSVSALSKVHSHVDICVTACVRTRGYYSILWFTIALYTFRNRFGGHIEFDYCSRPYSNAQVQHSACMSVVRAILAFDVLRATLLCHAIQFDIIPSPTQSVQIQAKCIYLW